MKPTISAENTIWLLSQNVNLSLEEIVGGKDE